MTAVLIAAGAGVAAAGWAACREWRWRRLVGRELSEEARLSILSEADLHALATFDRFRDRWMEGRPERRILRGLASRLAAARRAQRSCAPARRRLLQVEILTLRTRLRKAKASLGGAGDFRAHSAAGGELRYDEQEGKTGDGG